MSPDRAAYHLTIKSAPRVSGDEPYRIPYPTSSDKCSPRERG